jgi:hypothetical protein
MAKRICVVGASLGGLVAAAELRELGYEVSVLERNRVVGGLYSKVATPFGTQELGMHVLYVDERQLRHLHAIFGAGAFDVLRDHRVDHGASANFGNVYFGSQYPSLLGHPLREIVLNEILARVGVHPTPRTAFDECLRRFGPTATQEVVAPILSKLWLTPATELTPEALHCYFDLRRLVVAPKAESDILKLQCALDEVVGNPEQSRPAGSVFGGRVGLTFRETDADFSDQVVRWASLSGISLDLGVEITCVNGVLAAGGAPICDGFDACIVAAPIHTIANESAKSADQRELSVCYFRLEEPLGPRFPAYYALAHDAAYAISRVVNYDAYKVQSGATGAGVLATESLHLPGKVPSLDILESNVRQMIPGVNIIDRFPLQRTLPITIPSLSNRRLLDGQESLIRCHFGGKLIYFVGMRTDAGVFFSHQTIGLAYDSALACHRQFA